MGGAAEFVATLPPEFHSHLEAFYSKELEQLYLTDYDFARLEEFLDARWVGGDVHEECVAEAVYGPDELGCVYAQDLIQERGSDGKVGYSICTTALHQKSWDRDWDVQHWRSLRPALGPDRGMYNDIISYARTCEWPEQYFYRKELQRNFSEDIKREMEEEEEEEEEEEKEVVEDQGLDEAALELLPKSLGQEQLERECAICISEFEEDEACRRLPQCGHSFHLPCIDRWLSLHSTCPLCRTKLAA